MVGGMCGRGYMAEGMHGGGHGRGNVWQGTCMMGGMCDGGHVWQGVHGRAHAW